jgi:hypothetical protein
VNDRKSTAPFDHANALRTVAELIEDARRHGAKLPVSIHAHSLGVLSITIPCGDGGLSPAEFSAWQLASRAVWETHTEYIGHGALRESTTRAEFKYRDVDMLIQFYVNAPEYKAVA